jgi:hypothetical protein
MAKFHITMTEIEGEEWKDIPGFAGYQASSHGRIATYWRNIGKRPSIMKRGGYGISDTPRLLSQSTHKKGYKWVTLNETSGKPRVCRVHTLVLLSFVGKRPEGYEGRHLDDDKENNNLSNLKWGTPTENKHDSALNQRDKRQKLTVENVHEIRSLLDSGLKPKVIAERFGVDVSSIGHIKRRASWNWV